MKYYLVEDANSDYFTIVHCQNPKIAAKTFLEDFLNQDIDEKAILYDDEVYSYKAHPNDEPIQLYVVEVEIREA